MKELLSNLQTKLKANLSYLKSVIIVPDLGLIPETAAFPLLAIVDAGMNPTQGKMQRTERLAITIGAYQSIARSVDSSVMGDINSPGVIDMISDTEALLRKELFSGSFQNVRTTSHSGTVAVSQNNQDFITRKTIGLEYTRILTEV
jgi:hypothetical protein